MSDSDTSDSNSVIMSEDSDSILIESLEAQVEDLQFESKLLNTKTKELEIRIKVLQNISDSELVNQIFHY
jgi:chaperonin cofactor prefoldin